MTKDDTYLLTEYSLFPNTTLGLGIIELKINLVTSSDGVNGVVYILSSLLATFMEL